jgi:hypothetical protein
MASCRALSARERTRTSTGVTPLGPQPSASASSATRASDLPHADTRSRPASHQKTAQLQLAVGNSSPDLCERNWLDATTSPARLRLVKVVTWLDLENLTTSLQVHDSIPAPIGNRKSRRFPGNVKAWRAASRPGEWPPACCSPAPVAELPDAAARPSRPLSHFALASC